MRAPLLNASHEVAAPVIGSDHAWRERVQTERHTWERSSGPRDGPGLECIEGRGVTVACALQSI